MALFLLLLLILTALVMIGWGLRQRHGLLTYPTLAGAAWLCFVVPQAIGLLANPHRLPTGVIKDRGIELTLLMCVLCAALSFLGYVKPPATLLRPQRQVRTIAHYSDRRLFQAGMFLALVGLCGWYMLTRLTGGILAYYSVEGGYALEWRGLPVVYVWFAGFGLPGLIFSLVATLRAPSSVRWAGVALAAVLPLTAVVLSGRREVFISHSLAVVLSVYFTRRKAPSRWILVPAIVAAFLVVQLAPAYRTHFRIGADVSQLRELAPLESTESVFEGREGVTEMEYAVVQIAAAHRAGRFNYGVRFYNGIVSNWVPRLIFGDAFKESLFLPTADHRGAMLRYYDYRWPYGSFPSGFMDAFREFWFFGALVFLLVGFAFRAVWERSQRGSVAAQLCYMMLAILALTSVVKGVTAIPSSIMRMCLYLVPALAWARVGIAALRRQAMVERVERVAGTTVSPRPAIALQRSNDV